MILFLDTAIFVYTNVWLIILLCNNYTITPFKTSYHIKYIMSFVWTSLIYIYLPQTLLSYNSYISRNCFCSCCGLTKGRDMEIIYAWCSISSLFTNKRIYIYIFVIVFRYDIYIWNIQNNIWFLVRRNRHKNIISRYVHIRVIYEMVLKMSYTTNIHYRNSFKYRKIVTPFST